MRAITTEHNVSEAELSALHLALCGQTAELIAKTLEISAASVRKGLGSVYQKFGIAGGTAGKLEVLSVVWRSLRHCPSIKEILADRMEVFSKNNAPETDHSDTERSWERLKIDASTWLRI